MIYKYQKKGAQGIGTLIIFIAMILVAAVAAGVLIQTSSSLQSKSLDVGRQSQEKITSDIDVVQVYATDTSDGAINATSANLGPGGGTGDSMTMVVRLGSGSSPIKLSDLIVKLDTSSGTQTLTSGTALNTTYGTTFIINGTNHQTGYLVEGDLAQFSFYVANSTNIAESDSVTLRLITKNGAVKPVDITTPAAMVETTTYLFP